LQFNPNICNQKVSGSSVNEYKFLRDIPAHEENGDEVFSKIYAILIQTPSVNRLLTFQLIFLWHFSSNQAMTFSSPKAFIAIEHEKAKTIYGPS
jgi:hypothetical protein